MKPNEAKQVSSIELIDRLRTKFGYGWFTAKEAREPQACLKELVAKDLLITSKSYYAGTVNYRVAGK